MNENYIMNSEHHNIFKNTVPKYAYIDRVWKTPNLMVCYTTNERCIGIVIIFVLSTFKETSLSLM